MVAVGLSPVCEAVNTDKATARLCEAELSKADYFFAAS